MKYFYTVSMYAWGNAHPSNFNSKINFMKMSFNNFQRKYMSLYAQDKIDDLEFFKDFYITCRMQSTCT